MSTAALPGPLRYFTAQLGAQPLERDHVMAVMVKDQNGACGQIRARAGRLRAARSRWIKAITDRADLARATFYAHYPNKEAVQFSVFNRLTEDLVRRLADQGGTWNVVHRDAISAAYKQAAEMPDLYRAA